jgi:hypothetical protein
MIEELGLPKGRRLAQDAQQSLRSPLLPTTNRFSEGVGRFRSLPQKEMDMIRHDDVATHGPAVTIGQSAPFFAKDFMGPVSRKW